MHDPLQNELARLADVPDPTPPETEQALLAAYRRRRAGSRARPWLFAAAAAAVLLVAFWLEDRPPTARPETAETTMPAIRVTPFIVLDPLAPAIADGRGRLVRLDLPPGEGFAGLPRPLEARSSAIQADVLIGDDGVPHAVRFVY